MRGKIVFLSKILTARFNPNVAKVEGAAVVIYRKPLTTQVEDPVSAGRCGAIGFPVG